MVTSAGALAGIKVVEIGHWLVAPYCTNMLSDLGADVVKIEPLVGDQVRHSGSYFLDGESYLFAAYNHGKKSIALNLKDPEGLQIALDLCKEADVIVENYKPGTCERLGIGYDAVSKLNPRVVYCSISAFGDTKGYAERPGMDPIMQGMGAVMSMTGEIGGRPLLVGVPIADNTTAYMAFGAICAALFERERTACGQHLWINLIDTMVFNLATRFGQYVATGQSPVAMGHQHAEIVPYQAFPTADGWIMAGAQSDDSWQIFCQAIGREDIADHPDYRTNQDRVTHRTQLTAELDRIFATKTTDEWCARCTDYRVLHGPIWTVAQLVESDVICDHQLIKEVQHPVFGSLPVICTPITYSRSQVEVQGPPPLCGEHSVEILTGIGRSAQAISDLIERGVVHAHFQGSTTRDAK